jgi:hypothetical protein
VAEIASSELGAHAAEEVDELGVTQATFDLDLPEAEDARPPVLDLGLASVRALLVRFA